MKAELKDLVSLDFDPKTYSPEYPENFGFWLRAMIGLENEEGAESFDIHICTPDWIKANYDDHEILFGRHMLLVFEYDYEGIRKRISDYCHECTGENWPEIAERLSRIGYWEFEDYQS